MRTKSIATALALGFLAYLLPVMTAQAGCVWRGTAPFCAGECEPGEKQIEISGYSNTEGSKIAPFGKDCVSGSKALCCTAEPTQPPAANAQPETDPEFASFCNRYADDAVEQAKKNTEMKCGLEKENPDRWTSDRQAHFDWCISWDGAYAEPAREGSYRVVGLKDCADRQAAMQQSGVLKPLPEPGGIFKQTIPATTPPPPPPPPPQGGGGAEYATATTPATIYKEPGGPAFKDANGDDIGMPVGSKALVLQKQTNPLWYKLQTPPLTPEPGWVWGEDVTLGP